MNDTYTTTVTEIHPIAEVTTAVIDVRMSTGENFTGPIICGYCKADAEGECPEMWIEQEGRRVQFPVSALNAIVKQLKRTNVIALG